MPLHISLSATAGVADRRPCVGKYQVDVASFDKLALPAMRIDQETPDNKRLVVVDEVGKMELFSGDFVEAVRALFDSHHCVVLGTIPVVSAKSHWLIDELRKRDYCQLYEVSTTILVEMFSCTIGP